MDESEFYMYHSILSQPEKMALAVNRNMDAAIRLGSAIRSGNGGRLYLVGTGTSLHAAELAYYFFTGRGNGSAPVSAFPFSSYEFVNYPPALSKEDTVLVISHRGYKRYSRSALQMARQNGCVTAAITGIGSTVGKGDADFVFETVEQEKSSAHTVSFTSALAMLLSISIASAKQETDAKAVIRSTTEEIISLMGGIISGRDAIRSHLSGMPSIRRIWISGSGPNRIVAKEGSLKIQETCYLDAYGFEIEQLIHGPMRAASIPDDLFIPIIWGERDVRSREFVDSIAAAGGNLLTISSSSSDRYNCLHSDIHLEEYLSPFITVIPLQFIALYLAVIKGTDPDSYRSTDALFSKIDATLKL
jgi:glucosamine--fructose-6-phosphate aminotransferase (isomerizing)